mmetsp:Transcript_7490/g.9004  ORF Transcript_7490/g.9004 Transcript_7490/m.9004 type:complete len:429 (+) Transcript_7490:180-1466(+)
MVGRKRKVVVTGLGLITPLGGNVSQSWSRLIRGETGVSALDASIIGSGDKALPCHVAAQVDKDSLETDKWISNSRSQGATFITYALGAAYEALQDANWPPNDDSTYDPTRTGVAIGSGIGSAVEEVTLASQTFDGSRGLRRLSPYFVPRLLINQAAGHVSIEHNLQGPNHSCVTACASGAHSIGDASRLIEYGDADVMVAGGTESSVNSLSLAGFSRLKALSTRYNDTPELASRPFDKHRDGFVMGEGAGVVILEEENHALNRGANIYAEVSGYGLSGDAFHMTAPAESGRGAINCMRMAMKHASLSPKDIDYINAHATSTPIGDDIENLAIENVLGERLPSSVNVSSTKGATGHLLGAAGAVEAIFTILAVKTNILPPTVNLTELDELLKFNYIPNTSQEVEVKAALCNSFGFGGTNASLAFTKHIV